jgi:hypothetical protein
MLKKVVFLVIVSFSLNFAQLLSPKVAVQQSNFDFGTISQGKSITHEFVITNNGGDLLRIDRVRATCGCTAAEPQKKELAPGESTKIKVDFNSTGRLGKQNREVFVYTNDPEKPEIKLTLTGNVLEEAAVKENAGAKIFFPQTQHDFGVVKEGKIMDYTFKFKNTGKSTLEIKDIKTSCGCTAALASSKKIEPGKEGTLKIELDTSNRSGRMSRNITVFSNDPEEPQKILTIFAEIKN